VPFSPEFGNVACEIRVVEVSEKFKTQQSCRSESNVGVTGEVAVNLKSKKYCAYDQAEAGVLNNPHKI
jgi:hypothetical protein